MAARKKSKSPVRRWARYIAFALGTLVALSFIIVLPLRWVDPATSAFMLLDDSGRQPVLFEWADWQDIGLAPALAVVAAEDQRFADHVGIDFESMRKAVQDSSRG
ncbi:MAG: monofunctional biosynthetic peptidoglycan transglycosylase, partial [Woeseiaceae bacterium]